MNRITKALVGLAAAAALTVTVAACSSSSKSSSSTADSKKPVATISSLTGKSTSVKLDAGFSRR